MIDRKLVFARLATVEKKHQQMAKKFAEFSGFVSSELTASNFLIKGILVTPADTSDQFSVSFAGRTIHFAFSVAMPGDSTTVGRISCFLEKFLPKAELEQIGSFSFKSDGETSEKDAQDEDPIYLDHPNGASAIAMHYLNVALSKH